MATAKKEFEADSTDTDSGYSDNTISTVTERELPSPFSKEAEKDAIDFESIALALRTTCEVNRRLCRGTDGLTCAGGHCELTTDDDDSVYGDDVHVHPSQTWFHPIQRSSTTKESSPTLTVFHAKSPRTSKRPKQGTDRWGPDLASYLRRLHDTLRPSDPVAFALALIYLDRACSAETPRQEGACPHLTPRTVHRLVLAAVVLASKAAGDEDENAINARVAAAFGVSPRSLAVLEARMLSALGDMGTWVDHDRVYGLWAVWRRAFYNDNTNRAVEGPGIGIPKPREVEPRYQQQQQHAVEDHPQQQHFNNGYTNGHQQQPSSTPDRIVRIRRTTSTTVVQQQPTYSSNNYYDTAEQQPRRYNSNAYPLWSS